MKEHQHQRQAHQRHPDSMSLSLNTQTKTIYCILAKSFSSSFNHNNQSLVNQFIRKYLLQTHLIDELKLRDLVLVYESYPVLYYSANFFCYPRLPSQGRLENHKKVFQLLISLIRMSCLGLK